MDKNSNFSTEEKILMKSIFSVKEAIHQLRDIGPVALEQLSIIEVYELLTEFIELVLFMRKGTDSVFPSLNPTVMVDPNEIAKFSGHRKETSFTNVGGLMTIRVKNTKAPMSKEEYNLLETMRVVSIRMKRSMVNNRVEFPKLSVIGDFRIKSYRKRKRQKSRNAQRRIRKSRK
jgi:hypothetical protein